MATFLVEGYLAAAGAEELAAWANSVRRATTQLRTAGGSPFVYMGSIFVPTEQTCFSLFEASSAVEVAEACRRAGIPCDRVSDALVGDARRLRS